MYSRCLADSVQPVPLCVPLALLARSSMTITLSACECAFVIGWVEAHAWNGSPSSPASSLTTLSPIAPGPTPPPHPSTSVSSVAPSSTPAAGADVCNEVCALHFSAHS